MSIRKRGERWQVRVTVAGQRIEPTLPAGATRKDAQEAEKRLLAANLDAKVGRPQKRLFDEALLQWLQTDARSQKSYKVTLYRAQALQAYSKGKTLSQATDIAADVVRKMQDKQRTPAAINRYLALIKRVCNLAHKWGWATENYGARIQMLGGEEERHVYLSPEQVMLLAASAPSQQCRAAILLASLTGLRRGELLGLTSAWITPTAIRLSARTKTGKPRMVPLTPEAAAIAQEAVPFSISTRDLRREFEAAREAAGMPHVHFHDLRHTYASWLVQEGISLRIVQAILGHTTLQMTGRYSHLEDRHSEAAVSVLPKLVSSGSDVGQEGKK